jgi:hypothetical protein
MSPPLFAIPFLQLASAGRCCRGEFRGKILIRADVKRPLTRDLFPFGREGLASPNPATPNILLVKTQKGQ